MPRAFSDRLASPENTGMPASTELPGSHRCCSGVPEPVIFCYSFYILDDYNYSRFSVNKDSVISSYYLYLTALLRKSGSQVNKAFEELNKAYMKEPTSWELVCLLIDIDPEYHWPCPTPYRAG